MYFDGLVTIQARGTSGKGYLNAAEAQETPNEGSVSIWASTNGSDDAATCGASSASACSLNAAFRRAIDVLHTPPSVEILLAGGDYPISHLPHLTFSSFTLRSAPNSSESVRFRPDEKSAENQPNVLFVSGKQLAISDIIFSGFNSRVISFHGAQVTFRRATFENNRASPAAECIYLNVLESAIFHDCTFERNSINATAPGSRSEVSGAAVNLVAKSGVNIEFLNCTFFENSILADQMVQTASGAALAINLQQVDSPSTAIVTLQYCRFQNNSIVVGGELSAARMVSRGAAVSISGDAQAIIKIAATAFLQNKILHGVGVAESVAGGALYIFVQQPSRINISQSTFSDNMASAGVGKAYPAASAGNCQGGAVSMEGPIQAVLQASTFINNLCLAAGNTQSTPSSSGGAVFFSASRNPRVTPTLVSLRLEHSILDGNEVTSGTSTKGKQTLTGGAVSVIFQPDLQAVSDFFVVNSSFQNNSVSGSVLYLSELLGGSLFLSHRSPYFGSRMQVQDSVFSNNSLVCDSCSEPILKGGAVYISLLNGLAPKFINSTFLSNQAYSYFTASTAIGGALYIVSLTAAPVDYVFDRCQFIGNSVSGEAKARGGAFSIEQSATSVIRISQSVFSNNVVSCPSDTRSWFCAGGAVHTESTADTIYVLSSTFSNNTVLSLGCQEANGGAISTQGLMTAVLSSFLNNTVLGEIASGGAISSWAVNISHSIFEHNSAEGFFFAEGGSAIAQSRSLSLTHSTVIESSARIIARPPSINFLCGLVWGSVRPRAGYGGVGGSLALVGVGEVLVENVTISRSNADRGGAMSVRSEWQAPPRKIAFQATILDTSASAAGGAIFVFELPDFHSTLASFCNSTSRFVNVTADLYGHICATSPSLLAEVDKPEAYIVAPLQKLKISFVLLDGLNQVAIGVEEALTVTLLEGDGIDLHSGASRDSVFSGKDGLFTFQDLSLMSLPNNTAKLGFSINTPLMQKQGRTESIASTNMTITISGCLPSFYQVESSFNDSRRADLVCQACPFGTYRLGVTHLGEHDCKPCNAELGEHFEGLCLIPPPGASGHWVVPSGFYPVPSLDAPIELLRCPNEGCLQFDCHPYSIDNITWHLNCSGCPKHDQQTEGHEIGKDCHCEPGFEGRLCSRCSCDKQVCYFSSGSAEERECVLCNSPSTAVIVSAVFVLQLSLVVFLIFKQSAIALVLSEIAIVVILILMGIGEFWMFDLVLILGLLFVITSLSQRPHRDGKVGARNPLLLEHSEGEGECHEEHHGHETAARSAALVKIILFFIQTTAAVVKAEAWPHWVLKSVKQLDALNLRVSGIECFAPTVLSTPEGKILVQLFMPLILGVNILLAAVIATIFVKLDPVSAIKSGFRKCKKKSKQPPNREGADTDALWDGTEAREQLFVEEDTKPLVNRSERKIASSSASLTADEIAKRVQFSVLFLLSASYFELSNAVFEILRPCSHGHMVAFPFIPCSLTERHFTSLLVISILFFLLYTVGIPVFFGVFMRINRRRIVAGDPNIEARVGFLYESYKPKFFWWELVWFLRRILLSAAVTILVEVESLRTVVIVALLLGSIFVQRAFMPFNDRAANFFDLASSTSILVSVVIASEVSHIDKYEQSLTEVLRHAAFAVNVLVCLAVILALVLPAAKTLINRLRAKVSHQNES